MCVLCDSYGPIYAVSLGSVSCVVLNNMCTISDAFEGKAHIFSDRPNWLPLMNLIYQERGTSSTSRDVRSICIPFCPKTLHVVDSSFDSGK